MIQLRATRARLRATTASTVLGALCCSAVAQTAPPEPARVTLDPPYAHALPIDRGSAGLAQTLRKLHTRGSLIQINAHPDDEDGGMLTYVSRALGADVSLLSLNRGEGGQNVMTGDFWDQLGVLRTQEHMAANRYYGVHLFYTRVADFGFSKTLEEALKQWNHDRVLADVVRVVRTVRPMVVTSVFAGYVSDGHGHHQTAGVMAQEVFNAAGDPKMFPEQIKEGLRPWKPLKVYARVPFARVTEKGIFDYATAHWEPVRFKNYVTGESINGVPTTTLTVPEGEYNAQFARSYLQVAREGLNEQKSQNGGVAIPAPGRFDSPYHLYASRVAGGSLPQHETAFFDGIDTSLSGMAAYLPASEQAPVRSRLEAINAQVDEATHAYSAADPTGSAPALARGLDLTRALIADLKHGTVDDAHFNVLHELELKEGEFNLALGQSLGLSMAAVVTSPSNGAQRNGPPGPIDAVAAAAGSSASSPTAIAGQKLLVGVHVACQGNAGIRVDSVKLESETRGDWKPGEQTAINGPLPAGSAKDALLTAVVPADAEWTQPYFSRPNLEQSFYDIHDPRYLTLPTMPYPLTAVAEFTYNGTRGDLREVVQTAHRSNGQGITVEPLLIAPAISVRVSPPAGVMALTTSVLPLDITVHSNVKGPAEGSVELKLPHGWTASPATGHFQTLNDGEEVGLHFEVSPKNLEPKQYNIAATAQFNGQAYTQGFSMIGYPGVLPYPQYRPAGYRTTAIDVKTAPGLRVGFVMGTGEEIPQSLRDIGIHVTELSPSDIAGGDLSAFDCIVLGIRTYAARPELRAFNNRLLDYVKKGGVIISEYQTSEYDHNYGPYPLSVPGDAEKVVEEDAKVTILKPEDPAMSWPNQIGPKDFEGWVEERGHGFARTYDSHFTALTEVHDVGQDPQTGGLVYAPYGKGFYVYLSYAFFREMPEGVPGSFRIMANLLSLGKNPKAQH